VDKSASYHINSSAFGLRGRERYHRRRDNTLSPFRSNSEIWLAELIRRREYRNAYNLRPPHYFPSFVHGTDATPAHLGPQLSTGTLRNISSGFWTVGGRASVQTGQLPGIISASGNLLASGATAPLHSANFLGPPTPGDCIIDHGRRLALALEIDQANRILHPPSIEDTISSKFLPDRNKYVWKDSTWMRESLAHCKSRLLLDFSR
jgi:hypothetical protein